MVHFQKLDHSYEKANIKRKHSCYIYGEGRKDKDFLKALIDLKKFKYHTPKWVFNYDNASGGSAKTVLEKCKKAVFGYSYDLVLCFIDLDHLKANFSKTWKKEKKKLEKYYFDFIIIWQIYNAEDEYKKVLGDQYKSKHKINKLARKKIEEF